MHLLAVWRIHFSSVTIETSRLSHPAKTVSPSIRVEDHSGPKDDAASDIATTARMFLKHCGISTLCKVLEDLFDPVNADVIHGMSLCHKGGGWMSKG